MVELFTLIFVIIVSFFILIKSSDFLISSSSEIGRRAKISKFVIGLTLVAVGTSLPEFFTAIISIFSSENSAAFILGTIIGSNISNILLVFGILLTFSNNFNVKIKKFNLYFLFFSTMFLISTTLYGLINFYQGVLYIVLFLIYIYVNIKKGSKKEFEEEVIGIEDSALKKKSLTYVSSIFFLSLIGLNFAAKGVVYGIENLGLLLSIPLEFLTLTTVALATSLPELFVTYSSAKKNEFDLAVGNIIGSNISNILFIIGSAGLIKNITFDPSNYYLSIIILFIVTLIFIFSLSKKNITKNYGLTLFIFYFLYIILVF